MMFRVTLSPSSSLTKQRGNQIPFRCNALRVSGDLLGSIEYCERLFPSDCIFYRLPWDNATITGLVGLQKFIYIYASTKIEVGLH